MKRNDISVFRNSIDGGDFPPVILIFFVSVIATIIGFIGMTGGAVHWPYVLFPALSVLIGSIVGYQTNIARAFTRKQMALWERYKKLPNELKNKLPLTTSDVLSMSSLDANRFKDKLDKIYSDHLRVEEIKSRDSGATFIFSEHIKAVEQDIENELEVHKPERQLR